MIGYHEEAVELYHRTEEELMGAILEICGRNESENTFEFKTPSGNYKISVSKDGSISFKDSDGNEIYSLGLGHSKNDEKDLSTLIAKRIFADNAEYISRFRSNDLPIVTTGDFSVKKNPSPLNLFGKIESRIREFNSAIKKRFKRSSRVGYLDGDPVYVWPISRKSVLTNIMLYPINFAYRIINIPHRLMLLIGLDWISRNLYKNIVKPVYSFITSPLIAFANLFSEPNYLVTRRWEYWESDAKEIDANEAAYPRKSLVTRAILYAKNFLKRVLYYPGDLLSMLATNIPIVSPFISIFIKGNWMREYIVDPLYKNVIDPIFNLIMLPVVGFANFFSAPGVPYREEQLVALAIKNRVNIIFGVMWGINPNIRLVANDPHSSPLMYAIKNGAVATVTQLLYGGKCDVREDREIAYLNSLPRNAELTEEVAKEIKERLQTYIDRMTFWEKARSFNRNFFGTTLPVAAPGVGYYLRTRLLYPGLPYYLPTGIAKVIGAIGKGIVGLFSKKPPAPVPIDEKKYLPKAEVPDSGESGEVPVDPAIARMRTTFGPVVAPDTREPAELKQGDDGEQQPKPKNPPSFM